MAEFPAAYNTALQLLKRGDRKHQSLTDLLFAPLTNVIELLFENQLVTLFQCKSFFLRLSIQDDTVNFWFPLLRGQFGAAFLAATFQNQTTGTGRHASEKSNPAFTTAVRGLKSSFHFTPSLL